MKKQQWLRLLALLLTFALVSTACGGSDDEATQDTTQTDTTDEDADEADPEADEDEADADDAEADAAQPTVAAAGSGTGQEDTETEEATDVRASGGEIAVGLEAELVGMRPWADACGSPCMNVLVTIYDKLVEQTSTGTYEGWLLESITPNEDFTQWVGVLREGVVFHNGKPLTAQTIADMFVVQQEGSQSAGQIAASSLIGVEATGEFEVTYTTSRSNSAFPAYLERPQLGLVFDPEYATEDPDGYNEAPVGTGPFLFVSRDLDNETIVERNPDYWYSDADGVQLPYLDRISFRPIPDEGTRLDSVISGTTDVAHTLRQGTIRDARAARDGGAEIFLFEHQGNNVGGGMFNNLVPPFDDKRVRNALVYMTAQDQVIDALGGTGISIPGTQWFSPDSPWYSEKVAATYKTFDFEAGLALLTEYVNDPERSDGKAVGEPISTELSCPPDPTLLAAMQVYEQTWTSTGLVEVELTNYDQQTHIAYAQGEDNGNVGNHTTHCWRVSSDADPSTFLNSAIGAPPTVEVAEANGLDPALVSPLNWSNYFNPEVLEKLLAATSTADFDERYALYEEVMLQLNDDTPIWFSGHTATALVVKSNIAGLNTWELPNGSLGAGHPVAEGRWASAHLVSE